MSPRSRLGRLALLAAALAACSPRVEGNGVYAERVFDAASGLAPFDGAVIGFPSSVDVDGQPLAASVFVDAHQPWQVVLSGDENVIQHFRVEVDGSGTLHTSTDLNGYTSVHPPQLRIRLEAPRLAAVESIGGAEINLVDASAGTLVVTSDAGGHLSLSAVAGRDLLEVILSGGAQLDAGGYPVAAAEVALRGAAHATLWPSSQLSGSAQEGSTLLVKGGVGCAAVVLTGGSTCGPL